MYMYIVCVKVLLLDKLMGTLTTWHVNNYVQSSMYALFDHNNIYNNINNSVQSSIYAHAVFDHNDICIHKNIQ